MTKKSVAAALTILGLVAALAGATLIDWRAGLCGVGVVFLVVGSVGIEVDE